MKNLTQKLLIFILVLMLVSVRVFVQPYFYDPLIEYFKANYLHNSIPEISLGVFFLNIFYRYFLNTIISLAILYLVFNNYRALKFSFKFYAIAFVLLSVALFILLKYNLSNDYKLIFYVRRFLIHPIFLLVLLPAFYHQKLRQEN